jgi:hypothetical protein
MAVPLLPTSELLTRPNGAVTGIGSLSHEDARVAAALSFDVCPELPFVPVVSIPMARSVIQGLVGVRGVAFDDSRGLEVDTERLHPLAKVIPDLEHPAFAGLHAFIAEGTARQHTGPVKWQFTGPLTIGLALMRKGVPARTAFDVAVRSVRVTTRAVYRALDSAFPASRQLVLLDEPAAGSVLTTGFPVAPESAIDLLSGALAALEISAEVGVHCCGEADLVAVLASGPSVLSVPVGADVAGIAGTVAPFLERGGRIAWGAVPVDGPLASTERNWRKLRAALDDLEAAGCDATLLREQSIITPVCGLPRHDAAQVAMVFATCHALSHRLRNDSIGGGSRSIGRTGAN